MYEREPMRKRQGHREEEFMVLAKRLVKIYIWRISSQKLGVGRSRQEHTIMSAHLVTPELFAKGGEVNMHFGHLFHLI
jgi:hypothetical protein